MPTDSESTLQQRLHAGDRQALTDAFDRHRQRLQRIIQFRMDARLKGRLDADDILQEAWLSAEQRLHHFQPGAPQAVFVWLRLICQQTLINVYRRHLGTERRDAGRELPTGQQDAASSTSHSLARQFTASLTSPSHAIAREELSAQLISALDSMEPIDQEVIALRHFEELSNQEVACVLDISPTAASNRYIRALGRLKKILNQLPEFSGDGGGSGHDQWTD